MGGKMETIRELEEPNSIINMGGMAGTLQDIAYKIMEEQLANQDRNEHTIKERTIFVLGSKGVVSVSNISLSVHRLGFSSLMMISYMQGKTSIINNFLDRSETIKPTLALEYSFGRRTGGPGQGIQKQICNVWLGSLSNSTSLINIPVKSHGLDNFTAIIVLNLAHPDRLWADLEGSIKGLKQTISLNTNSENVVKLQQKAVDRIGSDHPDLTTLDIFPFPVVIVGGYYDKFQDFGILTTHNYSNIFEF